MLIRTTRTTTGTAIRATCAFATSRDRSVSPPPTIIVEEPVRTKRRLYTRSYAPRHKPLVFYHPAAPCPNIGYNMTTLELGRFLRGTPCFIHKISLNSRCVEQEMATHLSNGDSIRRLDVEAHVASTASVREFSMRITRRSTRSLAHNAVDCSLVVNCLCSESFDPEPPPAVKNHLLSSAATPTTSSCSLSSCLVDKPVHSHLITFCSRHQLLGCQRTRSKR